MKLVSLIVFSHLLGNAYAACTTGVKGQKCIECNENNTPDMKWTTRCDLQVSIKCTYVDPVDRATKSCFADDNQIGQDNPAPTWIISQGECDANPFNYVYPATIVYQMCNNNRLGFAPRPDQLDVNYIRFKNGKNIDAQSVLQPFGWDDVVPPQQCRERTIVRSFSPCTDAKPFNGMSISMDGLLDRPSPNYCRCFLREYTQSVITPNPATTAPTPNVEPCPGTPMLGEKCRKCNENQNFNMNWVTRCDLQVSIKCTYVDPVDRATKSCFVDDQIGNNNPAVKWSVSRDQCNTNPSNYIYPATIVYKMCNKNDEGFTPRPQQLDVNYIRFKNSRNLDYLGNLEPSGWDSTVPPQQCKEETISRTFEPCNVGTTADVKPFTGMSISMDGTLAKAVPNYCRCFLREWVRTDVVNALPSLAPSSGPTVSVAPSVAPSPVLSSEPSLRPSPALSSEPSLRPSSGPTVSVAPSRPPTDIPTVSSIPTSPPSLDNSPPPTVSVAPSLPPTEVPSVSVAPSLPPTEVPSVSVAPSSKPTPTKVVEPPVATTTCAPGGPAKKGCNTPAPVPCPPGGPASKGCNSPGKSKKRLLRK